jgi:hypothetical protein
LELQILNCIFSDELGALADRSEDVDRAALDSGLVGDNIIFWKLVEERFNTGYPVGSVDGPLWADKVHFHHQLIANYNPHVCPEDHGTFSSTDLRSMWKEFQKEYDRVFTNFKNLETTTAVSQKLLWQYSGRKPVMMTMAVMIHLILQMQLIALVKKNMDSLFYQQYHNSILMSLVE